MSHDADSLNDAANRTAGEGHRTPSRRVSAAKLAEAAGFSLEDLAANRAGEMTDGQVADQWSRGLKNSWPAGLALVAVTLFLIVRPTTVYSHTRPTVIHLVWDANTTLRFMALGLFAVLIFLLPAIVSWLDAQSKRALMTEGPLRRFASARYKAYGFRLNGSAYRVTPEAYDLLRDGWSCRVYYTPYTHVLLSFELV